jgi:hypothetical protein
MYSKQKRRRILSFVVIGSAFLLKKYLKRPESWSSWASKWVSGE